MQSIRDILNDLSSLKLGAKGHKKLKDLMHNESDEKIYAALEEMWEDYIPSNQDFKAEKNSIKQFVDAAYMTEKSIKLKSKRSLVWQWSVAASIIIMLGVGGVMTYHRLFKTQEAVEYCVVSTKAGETTNIVLDDGSKIRLNASSTLRYPKKSTQGDYYVTIEGEAYFDVAKQLDRKFIVQTISHKVEVIGTAFNVQSYAQDNTLEVVLLSGKVQISKSYGNTGLVVLEPHEKYTYNALTNAITVTQTSTENETAWLRNELVFRNESLKNVLIKMERFYGVSITSSQLGWLENELFNGRFGGDQVSKVLEILAVHYPITYTIEDNLIHVTLKK